ncbi:MAG: CpaD family pilus assembly protein [Erythrobacter sp.]|uniref:CpaD family pilus assembly protein n=1 Tax=Erythrobacter sp. TaxID=1042 RepID=UPI003C77B9A4
MNTAYKKKLMGAVALGLGLTVAACGGMPENRSLYSTKQPEVERTNYTLDLNSTASGLPISEQQRMLGWFETMDLAYGDRITVEDPAANPAVGDTVSELAGRYGLMVSEVAPTTNGYLEPGQVRVVITRTTASVPECPDWSAKSDMNYANASSPNYGCAINSNLAAMVADPEDLLKGKEATGDNVIQTGNKAIQTYRETAPTGAGGLMEANQGGN